MMLKDLHGRTVLVKDPRANLNSITFWVRSGLSMVPISEATICKGDDLFLNIDVV